MAIIPAMQEAEVELQAEVSLDKSVRQALSEK
jgi:hypothetical protein